MRAARRQPETLATRSLPHFLFWLLLLLPACAAADSAQPLIALDVAPAVLHADGTGGATIAYGLNSPAVVSIALEAQDAPQYVLRDRVSRGPGTFSFFFKGAVDGSVLPNGNYTVVAAAEDGDGGRTELRQPLTIASADTTPPVLAELRVNPTTISPNQDGVADRLTVQFTVAEPVTVNVRLLAGGEVRWLARNAAAKPGEIRISWPQPVDHAPQLNQAVDGVPPGPAVVEVAIQDPAGNRTAASADVTIGEVGTPRVQVTDIRFAPVNPQFGGTITVAATIVNTGAVTLRAAPSGPTAYSWGQNAHELGYAAETGTVRWGVEYSLNRSGVGYPFRWSLGRDLPPGERVTVTGVIELSESFPLAPVQLWVGVMHENNRVLADRRGITRVHLAND